MESVILKPISICACPDLIDPAARWFSEKWGIPAQAYRESMQASIAHPDEIPFWYLVLAGEGGRIVAGAGVIDNDFHDRTDLTPNVCALFVEAPFRGRGLARALLDTARRDLGGMGIRTVYLITDHTEFYEKCGWTFHTTVRESSGGTARMYAAATL